MTYERKIVVGLDDISAVTFECLGCCVRLTILPEKLSEFPRRCPQCLREWIPGDPTNYTAVASAFSNFLRGLLEMLTLIKNKAAGVAILLEFNEPSVREQR